MGNKPLQQRLADQLAKRATLDRQIKELEAEQAKRHRREQARRAAIVGNVIYKLVASGEWSEDQVIALVKPHLNRASDRKLFGLEALPADGNSTIANKATLTDSTEQKTGKGLSTTGKRLAGANQSVAASVGEQSTTETVAAKKSIKKLPVSSSDDSLAGEFNL